MKKTVLFILFLNGAIFSQNADITLLKNINLYRDKSLDNTFMEISNTVAPLAFGTPVVIFGAGYLKKDTSLERKGLYVAGSVLSAAAVTTLLKYTVNRQRPYATYPDIQNQITESDPSFPSGHTTNAFSLATSLSIAFPKWYVIAPAFTWAAAVGYSRMDLGVHYPSDVLVGALIGAGSAYLCNWVNKKLRL